MTTSFAAVLDRAARHHGGPDGLEARLAATLWRARTAEELRAVPDDRFLAEATRVIFQAGFDWAAIDRRWPEFEAAFEGFDPARWSLMSDDDLDRLMEAPGIVRNAAKLRAVGGNAAFFSDVARSHGSVAAWILTFPASRYMELVRELKTRGDRLGGKTGQLLLRRMGVPSLICSDDVVKALIMAEVVSKAPSSVKDFAAVQAALDRWQAETGFDLTRISRILALSVG
ncbi:DNA-3-methyladenine glycosylase I (plasmid) [Tistrella mobilis]|uniref:DNA-3-methyladenine glycosylase I n=1 Tax=Tistrella mobilis TaxID=171437 RepID=UPI003556E3AF